MPSSVEQVTVDKVSGYPAHDDFETRVDYALKGTLPALPDPIHSKVKVCRDDGRKLATEAKIAANDFEEKEFIALREEDPVSQDGRNRWQEGINAWVEGQEGDLYKPPTDYCGESSDVSVKLSQPENEKKYDGEEIDVHIDAGSDEGIEKMELWVDGSKRETINDHTYKGKIHLPAGQHELYAKAFSRGGKEAKSNTVKIGTGGQDWKAPDPTATPAPTSAPTPTTAPSPTSIPVPSITIAP